MSKTGKNLTKAQRREILMDRYSGIKTSAIAAKYNISERQVIRIVVAEMQKPH